MQEALSEQLEVCHQSSHQAIVVVRDSCENVLVSAYDTKSSALCRIYLYREIERMMLSAGFQHPVTSTYLHRGIGLAANTIRRVYGSHSTQFYNYFLQASDDRRMVLALFLLALAPTRIFLFRCCECDISSKQYQYTAPTNIPPPSTLPSVAARSL